MSAKVPRHAAWRGTFRTNANKRKAVTLLLADAE